MYSVSGKNCEADWVRLSYFPRDELIYVYNNTVTETKIKRYMYICSDPSFWIGKVTCMYMYIFQPYTRYLGNYMYPKFKKVLYNYITTYTIFFSSTIIADLG